MSPAQSKDSDQPTRLPEGPVQECIAEEIPEGLVNDVARLMVDDLSDATNTPEPANQLACGV